MTSSTCNNSLNSTGNVDNLFVVEKCSVAHLDRQAAQQRGQIFGSQLFHLIATVVNVDIRGVVGKPVENLRVGDSSSIRNLLNCYSKGSGYCRGVGDARICDIDKPFQAESLFRPFAEDEFADIFDVDFCDITGVYLEVFRQLLGVFADIAFYIHPGQTEP